MLVAGCGGGSSSGSDPSASAGVAGAAAQDTFDAQLADQHPGSKAAGAKALVATTSTPATTVASTACGHDTGSGHGHDRQARDPDPRGHDAGADTDRVREQEGAAEGDHQDPHEGRHSHRDQDGLPPVPTGAFMPSKHPALAQTRFTVPGGNSAASCPSAERAVISSSGHGRRRPSQRAAPQHGATRSSG